MHEFYNFNLTELANGIIFDVLNGTKYRSKSGLGNACQICPFVPHPSLEKAAKLASQAKLSHSEPELCLDGFEMNLGNDYYPSPVSHVG